MNFNLPPFLKFSENKTAVLENLLDACASGVMSLTFLEQGIIDSLEISINRHLLSDTNAKLARRICQRVYGWKALQGVRYENFADHACLIRLIKDVALTENSFGIWLMNAHIFLASFDRIPQTSLSREDIRDIWRKGTAPSSESIITFLRCFTAISSIVVIYTWADSVPISVCRGRSLAILRLWQSTPGYDEV